MSSKTKKALKNSAKKPGKKSVKKPAKKRKSSKEKTLGIHCKNCGQEINPVETPPNSTWTLTSPLPDKEGRITLTVMGSFTCPRCGKNVKTSMKKIKSDDESGGKSKKEVLVETLKALESDTGLEDIAKKIGLTAKSIEKAISLLIKKGEISGSVEDGVYKIA